VTVASDSKPTHSNDGAYLTKEVLNRAVRKGVRQASKDAMTTAGSVVSTEGDWLVRSYQDGRVERLRKLDKAPAGQIAQKIAKLGNQ
jgi:hypothetical protein